MIFYLIKIMRFSRVLSRASRTEWKVPPMKDPWQPGTTFGLSGAKVPAYVGAALVLLYEASENAFYAHQIMEGGVARSSIGKILI